jgi:hypothetical protein
MEVLRRDYHHEPSGGINDHLLASSTVFTKTASNRNFRAPVRLPKTLQLSDFLREFSGLRRRPAYRPALGYGGAGCRARVWASAKAWLRAHSRRAAAGPRRAAGGKLPEATGPELRAAGQTGRGYGGPLPSRRAGGP